MCKEHFQPKKYLILKLIFYGYSFGRYVAFYRLFYSIFFYCVLITSYYSIVYLTIFNLLCRRIVNFKSE